MQFAPKTPFWQIYTPTHPKPSDPRRKKTAPLRCNFGCGGRLYPPGPPWRVRKSPAA